MVWAQGCGLGCPNGQNEKVPKWNSGETEQINREGCDKRHADWLQSKENDRTGGGQQRRQHQPNIVHGLYWVSRFARKLEKRWAPSILAMDFG